MLQAQITGVGQRTYPHYFLCYYSGMSTGPDWLSTSLLNFKRDTTNTVAAWSDCAASAIRSLQLPPDTLLIRALYSHETTVAAGADMPLDRLCRTIASRCRLTYLPGLLGKTRPSFPLHQLPSVPDRRTELDKVYRLNPGLLTPHQPILLIDDLLTTGLTAINIIKAIRTVVPDVRLSLFTLAKTEFAPDINKKLDLKGSEYQWNGVKWIGL